MSYQQNEYPEQSHRLGRPTRSVDNISEFAPSQLTGSSYMSAHPHAPNDTDRRETYQSQFVPDMSSNFKRDNNHSHLTKGSYSEYRGSQDYARNLRIQQLNEGYKPESRSSASDQSVLQTRTGSASYRDGLPAHGTDAVHHTRGDDDYDTNSVASSVYSQPSAIATHSDRASHVQDFSSETNRQNQTRDQAVPNEEEKPYVAYDRRVFEDAGHHEQTHSYENYQRRRNVSTSATEPEQQLYEAGYEGEDTFRQHNVNEEQNHSPAEGGYFRNNYRPVDLYGQYDVYNDFNNARIPQDNFHNEGSGRMNNLAYPTDETSAQSGDRAATNPRFNEKPRESIAATQKKTEKSNKRRCCSRQACVLITFIVLLVLGVALFFVWPRKPEVEILDMTKANAEGSATTATISLTPPEVQMDFNLEVRLRNQANWIPIKFKKIDVKMFDSSSMASNTDPVATGQLTDYTLAPRTDSDLPIPMTIQYIGKNANDETLQDFINACTTQNGTTKTTLNVRADFQLFIWGISGVYKPTVSTGKPDLECPFNDPLSNTN